MYTTRKHTATQPNPTGDSRCIVIRRSPDGRVTNEQLSWDAKPDVPEERRRIQIKGGLVAQLRDTSGKPMGAFRVFRSTKDFLPGLAMSRSLGDALAHSLGVVAKPAFKMYRVQPDDLCLVWGIHCVYGCCTNQILGIVVGPMVAHRCGVCSSTTQVLGTDGVFDAMDNQRVAECVCEYLDRRDPALSVADVLTQEAQEQWKTLGDDVCVDGWCMHAYWKHSTYDSQQHAYAVSITPCVSFTCVSSPGTDNCG